MHDVLIVGGGMVGASLAVALQPLGLSVAMVEAFPFGQAEQPAYDDRSIALSYGSSRIYQGMGIWAALRKGLEPIRDIHVSDQGHFGVTRLNAAREKVPALGYVVESRVLGEVLHAVLQTGSTQLLSPARVFALAHASDHVRVKIERNGVVDELQTRLLVVADGAKSPVRKMLGVEVRQRDYQQSAVIANVSTERAHNNLAYERFTPNGPLALLPMTQGRYSLVWTQANDQLQSILQMDDASFLAHLQHAFGFRQGRFMRVGQRSAYPLVLVKSKQEMAERAVIIGNASHTLHPVAGQGLNLALRDVAVLCDLLADEQKVQGDYGNADLLATYSQLRRPDFRAVLNYTDSLVRIFSNDFAPLGHARAAGLLAVDRIAPLRDLLARQSMGLRFRQARLSRGLSLLYEPSAS
ncbi:MAG: 2-octaprenyl-6-methoxyphenyl hydroxylase [Proteobacteria bacterium]|nr:MAG: 2-octaprenyl-6-methoxyphenyl hydroxylase [Pseudomonadota bacterium]